MLDRVRNLYLIAPCLSDFGVWAVSCNDARREVIPQLFWQGCVCLIGGTMRQSVPRCRGGEKLRSGGVEFNCEKLRENCGKIAENCGKLRKNCG